MTVNVHIRDLPDAVHRVLVKRARSQGMSLRRYVIDVLTEHTSLPTVDEWLADVEALPKMSSRESGAEAVRRSREQDDDHLTRGRGRR